MACGRGSRTDQLLRGLAVHAMLLPTIAPDTYGQATGTLQRVLTEAATISWFPVLPSGQQRPAVETQLRQHLTRLTEIFPGNARLTDTPIRWVEGDLRAFDLLGSALNLTDTEGRGDPMGSTSWGRRLGQLARDVEEQIETTPDLLDLVGPPLWPVRKKVGVVGSLLLESPPAPELQADQRRAMLSHVQYNLQHLLDWALAMPATLENSPFYSLFQVHCAGYYPVGLVTGAFTVFARTA